MKPLTITLRPDFENVPVDLTGITPCRIRELNRFAIERLPVQLTEPEIRRSACTLGDVFQVADGSPEILRMEGKLEQCSHIGGQMQSGNVEVRGNVGSNLGHLMQGGTVTIHGNAGHFAAAKLRGGHVRVTGNVGDYAAGDNNRGMAGGLLSVAGSAGRWLGTRMRRGIVYVAGDVGPGAATRMIAGTLVFGSPAQLPLGTDMQRGTIVFCELANGQTVGRSQTPESQAGSDAAEWTGGRGFTSDYSPVKHSFQADPSVGTEVSETLRAPQIAGFTEPDIDELSFLPILMREIASELPSGLLQAKHPRRVLRSLGDRASGGAGEVLWLLPK